MEFPDAHNDQGALGLDPDINDLPEGQPHVADNVLGPAPFREPMPPVQGEVALDYPLI